MPDDPNVGAGGAGVPTPARTRGDINPETYDALVEYYNQTNPYVKELSPLIENEGYRKHALRYAEDEEYRTFVDEAARFDEQARTKREEDARNAMPAWARELKEANDEIRKRFRDQDDRENQQTESAKRAYQSQQIAIANDLMAQHSLDEKQVRAIAAYGDQVGAKDLNEAYKLFNAAFKTEKIPASLRAAAGATGVPGATENLDQAPAKNQSELAKRFAKNMRAAKG